MVRCIKIICAIFLMVAECACQSIGVSHAPHHILPTTGDGKTFVVFPVRPERVGQLASTSFGVRLAQQMERHGYRMHRTSAAGRETFDLIVFYDYGHVERGAIKASPSKLYDSSSLKEAPNVNAPYSYFDILIVERLRKMPPSGIVYENRMIVEGKRDHINNGLIDAAFRFFPGESGKIYHHRLH